MTEITTGFLFIQPLYDLAFNMLIGLYRLLGENIAVAIIVFTLLLRFITLPFSLKQASTATKNKDFQAKYAEIQAKYKNKEDREKMTLELGQLQREYLPAQLGGCLPLILQLVFFFQVYYVITNILNVGAPAFNMVNYDFIPFLRDFGSSEVINLNIWGINLGQSASQVGLGAGFWAILPYGILMLLTGITQFWSNRVSMGMSPAPEKKEDKMILDKNGKPVEKKPEDMSFTDAMAQSSKSMMYIMPIMITVFSYSFPAGMGIYWTINNGFAIIQQAITHRHKIKAFVKKLFTGKGTAADLEEDTEKVAIKVKNA